LVLSFARIALDSWAATDTDAQRFLNAFGWSLFDSEGDYSLEKDERRVDWHSVVSKGRNLIT
jgi:hypothetical protein